jgi:DNA-binding MarR family transcriptional regulator
MVGRSPVYSDAVSAFDGELGARVELVGLMRRLGEDMRRRIQRIVVEHDLTPLLYAALRELVEPMPMSSAADRLCLDASYLTGLADRLEAMGLVERRPQPTDRRVKQLVVTERGAEVRRAVEDSISRGPGLFPELDEDDVIELIRIVRKILGD